MFLIRVSGSLDVFCNKELNAGSVKRKHNQVLTNEFGEVHHTPEHKFKKRFKATIETRQHARIRNIVVTTETLNSLQRLRNEISMESVGTEKIF